MAGYVLLPTINVYGAGSRHESRPRVPLSVPDRFADVAAYALGETPVPTKFGRSVRLVIATLLAVTLALPALELRSATDLYPGAPARVASLTAPFASIRMAPDPLAVELVQVDNGVAASIVAGPLPGTDGLLWYQVDISGVIGYIAEADLVWDVLEEVSAPALEAEPPVPVVTGNGVVISADGSPIGCLAAPAWDAAWLFTYTSGSLVDKAGEPFDGWQPVLCAAQLGYLPAAIVYDPSHLPEPEPVEVVTEIVVTESPEAIETPVESVPAPAPETTVTEEVVEETATVIVPEATDPPAGTVTPTETDVAIPSETEVVLEETAIVVIEPETSAPEVTATVTSTPTIGQTIPDVNDTPVVGQTVADVVAASIAGTAVVFNTGAGGLRCRAEASLDARVLLVLPLGTSLPFTGADSNGWTPVICGEQAGFVASRFLQQSDEQPTGDAIVDPSAALTGTTGVVQNTGGDGVRCRSGASLTASVVTVLSEGTRVSSRGAAVGVWQPVTCAGRAGFVHIDFLGNVPAGGSSGGGTGGSSSGSAVISGTNGDGVRFRASAGYDGAVIAVLTEGTSVSLRAGSIGSWTAVTYNGRNGFIYADFLSRNSSGGGSGGGSGVGGTNLAAGSNARVTDTLNFRNGASYSAGVIAVAGIGTVVRVTGSPSGGFYPVRWGSVDGYMHGDYLAFTTAALSAGPSGGTGGSTGGGAGAGSGSGSASGQALVNYAMRYTGYPYVWATHGPNSFDCSGFTYWVVLNVTGRDIGAGTWTQWGTGTPIQYGNLQPGDLVFFQNTFTVGLSHVGMYIGNDQFIHAENENTGVRISSLTSNYYSTRYLGARRLT